MRKVAALLLVLCLSCAGSLREFEIKLERIRVFMKEKGVAGVILNTQRNFAWLTGGGESAVVITSEAAAVSLLVTLKDVFLLAPNDEVSRFMDEELKGLPVKPLVYQWYEGINTDIKKELVKKIVKGYVGSDSPLPWARMIEPEFKRLRYQLLPEEIQRYKLLARETAQVVEEVAHSLKPGMSEEEIRALVAGKLYEKSIIPTVLLVGVDEGIFKYRHVIPRGRRLRRYAQINICAKRGGLVVALTRLVHFGKLSEEIKKRQRVAEKVYAAFLYGLKPGARISDIFKEAISLYGKYGYPGEWRKHHQGGAIGYNEREYIATEKSEEVVLLNQAFAFNPTLEGAKVEDTVLLTEKGVEILTYTGNWPYREVEYKGKKFKVPEILVKEN